VDQIIGLAFKRASLIPIQQSAPGGEQLAHGRQLLGVIADSLQAYGTSAWVLDFEELTLTVDEETYSLPADVLNVVDDGSYIQSGESDTNQTTGETPVTQISAAQWNSLSSKSATGNPKLYWADRSAHTLEVRVWPVPSEAGTIRFLVHRQLGSHASGNVDLDFPRYWQAFLISALAHDLASDSAMPAEKVGLLAKERDRQLDWARLYSSPDEGVNISLTHTTPYGGCR
jgi:hypothetical protein